MRLRAELAIAKAVGERPYFCALEALPLPAPRRVASVDALRGSPCSGSSPFLERPEARSQSLQRQGPYRRVPGWPLGWSHALYIA